MVPKSQRVRTTILIAAAGLAWPCRAGWAQDSQPPATTSSATSTVTPDGTTASAPVPAGAATKADAKSGGFLSFGKKKEEYTGPTGVIALAPTPMLDEEGRQRTDPDGKLMWNKAVLQQRDKHGHPLFDEKGKPVFQTAGELGYDKDGHKLHADKVKPPKMTPVNIQRGVLTVDGMTGEAALNYDIADLKYLYLYAPTVGIVVVSNEPFPGAVEEKNAFDDKLLTVTADGHQLQLASDERLLDKKPASAYVMLDRNFSLPSKHPVVGYGDVRVAPYSWPGSKANRQLAEAAYAPPPPANIMPVQLLGPCPKGQMRMPAPKVLPGQTAPVPPCVAIAQAQAARTPQPQKPPVQASLVPAAEPVNGSSSTNEKLNER